MKNEKGNNATPKFQFLITSFSFQIPVSDHIPVSDRKPLLSAQVIVSESDFSYCAPDELCSQTEADYLLYHQMKVGHRLKLD